MTSPDDTRLLAALQRGLPLDRHPFEALAEEVHCNAKDLLTALAHARERGLVRRFGAVFDTRRLGYRSALCAVFVPADKIDVAAACLTPLIGVTHCYRREAAIETPLPPETPNLWFTLSYPADVFPAMTDEVRARLAPHHVEILPATRRYKVDVIFGGATRMRDESTEDDSGAITARERAVIRALQGDTEATEEYYAALARDVGMTEWNLLSMLEMWRRSGRLKRIGLVLAHRAAGYTSNAMCCWPTTGDTREAGRALAACGEVTHCYERPTTEAFPFSLYAMIHAQSHAEARDAFLRISQAAALEKGVMLLSTREYKKTSMTFFTR